VVVDMSKRNLITISDFYCTNCGNKGIPIPRKKGAERKESHLKALYCLSCKKTTNHVEIRPFGSYTYNDFKLEFDLGRFINGNRTPIKDLSKCKINCKYNVNGKCWNSNNSYECSNRIEKENKGVILYE
jgi:hypothetical protein